MAASSQKQADCCATKLVESATGDLKQKQKLQTGDLLRIGRLQAVHTRHVMSGATCTAKDLAGNCLCCMPLQQLHCAPPQMDGGAALNYKWVDGEDWLFMV